MKLRLLITRPSPGAEKTAARLEAMGHKAIVSPMLRYVPLEPVLPAPESFDGLVVTSANALRAFALDPVWEEWRNLPLHAVGDATADTAIALGATRVDSAGGDADALAAMLRKTPGRRLFYPCAAEPAADIAGLLAPAGHKVTALPVYEMRRMNRLTPNAEIALGAGSIDAALVYSRRTAEALGDALADLRVRDLTCLCISAVTAEALTARGQKRCYASTAPNETGMLALVNALENQQIGS
ncbi:uroporphyrinogen-III synthase [Cucumibacter marinus]|uniref:uroporphyrinogen-III synthase n=1 Tax=Cucumibacter marinus TaxID=1121252 RepID=UPI000423AF88|nr:uroporphyrinogen-III synthase [Cucumibacter marinus]